VVHSPVLSVVPGSAPLLHRVRRVRIALTGLALFLATRLGHRARPVLAQLREPAALVVARLRAEARRQRRVQTVRVRAAVVTFRSLQWRHHATSLLIATVILIAVARSQTSPEAR
jgi:hypothetical protein